MYYMDILEDQAVLNEDGLKITDKPMKHKDWLLARTRDIIVNSTGDDVIAGADMRVKIRKCNGILEMSEPEQKFMKKAIDNPGGDNGAYPPAFGDVFALFIRAFRNAPEKDPREEVEEETEAESTPS